MSVSVVIPCYNEEAVIEQVVRSCYEEIIFKVKGSELIVVDDCSKDRTFEILKSLSADLPQVTVHRMLSNGGHGAAVRAGYELATKEFVFQIDSDNQFEINDFWQFYKLRAHYEFIFGFRRVRRDATSRVLLSKILAGMNFILFGVWLNDANCPFRLMKRLTLASLLKDIDRKVLAPNIFISILAKRKKCRVLEIPVAHYTRKTGKSALRAGRLVRFMLKTFQQLVALRIRIK